MALVRRYEDCDIMEQSWIFYGIEIRCVGKCYTCKTNWLVMAGVMVFVTLMTGC